MTLTQGYFKYRVEKDRLQYLYNKYKSAKLVAIELNIPIRRVYHYIKKYNISPIPRREYILSDKNIDMMIKDYNSGKTFLELYQKYSWSVGKIQWILKEKNSLIPRLNNVPPRKKGSRVGSKNANWHNGICYREGKITHYNNYDGKRTLYKYEHRIVAEKMLGRKLLKNEIVHHIDGNGLNNNPENLQIMEQREHAKLHLGENNSWGH
jgi:hypothetical protein